MKESSLSTTVQGRYYWKLLWKYDNSDNKVSEINEHYEIEREKKVNAETFYSQKFNIKSGFTYKDEAGASLKFDGVGSGSAKTELNIHIDLALDLEKISKTEETISEKSTIKRDVKIGPGDK